jgi:hypothetical protein
LKLKQINRDFKENPLPVQIKCVRKWQKKKIMLEELVQTPEQLD